MPQITRSEAANGLPIHKVALPGTRALTVLVAFDAGARTERLGASLNAYTSHDLVAFHITCRAEVAPQAIDLLTDFVGRPRLDAEELERERGVVIQEIARAQDQPSVIAEHLIDEAAFGDHPLGRSV